MIDVTMGISEVPLVAFDSETSGIAATTERIAELGAVRLENGVITKFSQLVDIEKEMPKEAAEVNKITNKMLEGKPKIADVLPKFIKFCDGAVLVAHNAPFDVGFITAELQRSRLPIPDFHVIDSLKLSRLMFPHRGNHKLQGWKYEVLGTLDGPSHRATGDADLCLKLTQKLIKERFGDRVPQIREVLSIAGSTPTFSDFDILKLSVRFDQVMFSQSIGWLRAKYTYKDRNHIETIEGRPIMFSVSSWGKKKKIIVVQRDNGASFEIPFDSIIDVERMDPLS